MKLPEDAIVSIESAKHVGDYRIDLKFSDGVRQIVDFGPFLKRSTNPMIKAYLASEAFTRFVVKDGDLIWDDYELCFPVADLYEGNI